MSNVLRKVMLAVPGLRQLVLLVDVLSNISDTLTEIRHELSKSPAVLASQQAEQAFSQSQRYQDPKRLLSSAFKIHSQNGEDGMIAEIFRRIGHTSKVFVEIGVGDGRECNSAFLLACGWTGYWIDCKGEMNDALRRQTPSVRDRLTTVHVMVTAENVDSILERQKIEKEFDFLSIDIDQNTYYVWKALSRYRPCVVVIEYNPLLPAATDWKVNYSPDRVWDGSSNYGASLFALERLGFELGYNLVGCDYSGTNAFFVRADLVGNHFAMPFTAENHYEPARLVTPQVRFHKTELLDWPAPD